uniref:GDSL esterase/lipase n=1 Tax=Oryza glumipatula TaxID=40148 RepID=A0A0E0BEU1_9ORYZ
MGVAPLGCAPRVMWEGLHVVDGRSCVEEANELVQGYNARVAARLAALRPRLAGADVVFCDIYKGIMDIITHPARYGFDETRKACGGLGPFGGTVGCMTKEMVCPTPQRHVWWDLYSPTEVVTSLLANWSWSAPSHSNTTICRPITLEMLTGHISFAITQNCVSDIKIMCYHKLVIYIAVGFFNGYSHIQNKHTQKSNIRWDIQIRPHPKLSNYRCSTVMQVKINPVIHIFLDNASCT